MRCGVRDGTRPIQARDGDPALISSAVLHGLNDPAVDSRTLQVNDGLRRSIEIPAARADFVADDIVADPFLRQIDDIGVGDGAGLPGGEVLLIGRLLLGAFGHLLFILGIADQSAGRQSCEGANGCSSAGAAELFADDRSQGGPAGGADNGSRLGVIHV